jgi:hypothetical protein
MKNLNNFAHFALNNSETFEIKGGTFCSGNKYSSRDNCRPSRSDCDYSKPKYSGCNISFDFSINFQGCNSKPKTCNSTPAEIPVKEFNV